MDSHGVLVDSLVMVGGAARSSCWPQIVADVTGLPVSIPRVQEAAARGAAILAGVALGRFAADEGFGGGPSPDTVLEPRDGTTGQYEELFDRYWSKLGAPGG
jgi:xylulokinase